jgi:ubiquinone/menaquinone biosynthesis C-methylase UbiE
MSKTAQSSSYLAARDIHQEWESDYLNPVLDRFYDLAFDKIVAELGAQPGDTILDAGCGYGFHAERFARRGLKVVGIDFSPVALEAAKARIDTQALGIDLRQGDILNLPFETGSFEFVNCWGVLMHIPELEKAMSELARVLQPGGRLALMENNRSSLHVRFWEPIVRLSKRILGRQTARFEMKACGKEEWRTEGLMVRKLDIKWAERFYGQLGLRLVARLPGQFTEIYTVMPSKRLKRFIYDFNQRWLRRERTPSLAMGNILIFEKVRT